VAVPSSKCLRAWVVCNTTRTIPKKSVAAAWRKSFSKTSSKQLKQLKSKRKRNLHPNYRGQRPCFKAQMTLVCAIEIEESLTVAVEVETTTIEKTLTGAGAGRTRVLKIQEMTVIGTKTENMVGTMAETMAGIVSETLTPIDAVKVDGAREISKRTRNRKAVVNELLHKRDYLRPCQIRTSTRLATMLSTVYFLERYLVSKKCKAGWKT